MAPQQRKPQPNRAGRRPAARTSWENVAEWYDGWVGKGGSQHHQQLAVPAVMQLLALSKGESLLDIGCGQGALAASVLKVGASYTGVDASPALLRKAQQYHPQATFVLGDARKLSSLPGLKSGSFATATFMLSIQDMDPLAPVLQAAASMLKPAGRLVLLMTHPAFRIPRQSGWGWDEGRKLQFRRVDSYLSPLAIPLNEGATRSYHRPLGVYINALGDAGLWVDQMLELTTYKQASGRGPRATAEQRANQEFPLFLALRARKAG